MSIKSIIEYYKGLQELNPIEVFPQSYKVTMIKINQNLVEDQVQLVISLLYLRVQLKDTTVAIFRRDQILDIDNTGTTFAIRMSNNSVFKFLSIKANEIVSLLQ